MPRPSAAAEALRRQMQHFVPLGEQVLDQACRRVFAGESVPAPEKIVSLFEPHTQIIRRGKLNQPTEFGRKVWLDEVDGGIVSRYAVLAGNPSDTSQVAPALAHHQRLFGHPPTVFAGDRGVHRAENELTARQLQVKQVALPHPGRRRWNGAPTNAKAGSAAPNGSGPEPRGGSVS